MFAVVLKPIAAPLAPSSRPILAQAALGDMMTVELVELTLGTIWIPTSDVLRIRLFSRTNLPVGRKWRAGIS
jgi:hypothetical protein